MASPATESSGRRALRAAAVLGLVVATAVAGVTLVYEHTLPAVEASRRARQLEQLTEILGGLQFDNDPLADTIEARDPEHLGTDEPVVVHRVRLAGRAIAALLEVVAPNGYSGSIRLLVAIDAQSRVIGVRVIDHRETPGLGDFIDVRRSGWIHGFVGRAIGDPPPAGWQVRKDGGNFDQFTGATVTSRAVVGAVRNALEFFARRREQLLAEPTPPPST